MGSNLDQLVARWAKRLEVPSTDLEPAAVAAVDWLREQHGHDTVGMEDDVGVTCFDCLVRRDVYRDWLGRKTVGTPVFLPRQGWTRALRFCSYCRVARGYSHERMEIATA